MNAVGVNVNEALWPRDLVRPRARVITDNDYAGDPDGLVQLAHLLLTPSVEVRGVIASHHYWPPEAREPDGTADAALLSARDLATRCRRLDVAAVAGSNHGLSEIDTPIDDAAARLIIDEAMRTDAEHPLYVTCGGSLTAIASAWLLEPRIASRLTLVWIGGHEHDGLAEEPEPGMDMEYNTGLDPLAAQVVFNRSDLDIWQVPRDAYRQVLSSRAELLTRVATTGPLGCFLVERLGSIVSVVAELGRNVGEVYVLGDSPLVSLVALQTAFEPGPASNAWVTIPRPKIAASGTYEANPSGRPLRVFTRIDTRLIMEDLIAKLVLHDQR